MAGWYLTFNQRPVSARYTGLTTGNRSKVESRQVKEDRGVVGGARIMRSKPPSLSQSASGKINAEVCDLAY